MWWSNEHAPGHEAGRRCVIPRRLRNRAAAKSQLCLAEKVWGDCVVAAVIRMDDGRTDPLSLAHGIAPQCAVAHNEWSEAMIKENSTPQGQDAARERVNSSEIQFITSAIHIHRSKKHGNKP